MRTIEFRPRASVDLDGILVYIALTLKSPQAARNTADAIFAAIERAAELPELGQPFFDEDLDHQGYRRVLVKRYWIYYTYDAHTLTVRRVFHTMQDTDCYGFELLDDCSHPKHAPLALRRAQARMQRTRHLQKRRP